MASDKEAGLIRDYERMPDFIIFVSFLESFDLDVGMLVGISWIREDFPDWNHLIIFALDFNAHELSINHKREIDNKKKIQ